MTNIGSHMHSTDETRLLSTRVTIAMSGLVLWTGAMLVVLTYRSVEQSILVLELIVVLGAVVMAIVLARFSTQLPGQSAGSVRAAGAMSSHRANYGARDDGFTVVPSDDR
jgi:hypothetical protein